MTMTTTNEIKCSNRHLAILGIALRELNQDQKPIIKRLLQLNVEANELANVSVGKIWKLILDGKFNTKTLKMQIDRMWPTQVEAHDALLRKAILASQGMTTEWGLEAVDLDFEVKSFHKFSSEFVDTYNKIGRLKLSDDEMHQRFRQECKSFLDILNNVYRKTSSQADESPLAMVKRLRGQI